MKCLRLAVCPPPHRPRCLKGFPTHTLSPTGQRQISVQLTRKHLSPVSRCADVPGSSPDLESPECSPKHSQASPPHRRWNTLCSSLLNPGFAALCSGSQQQGIVNRCTGWEKAWPRHTRAQPQPHTTGSVSSRRTPSSLLRHARSAPLSLSSALPDPLALS